MLIYPTQLTPDGEHCRTLYYADASELRIAPGDWPDTLVCPGLGNGQRFYPLPRQQDGGRVYRQDCGIIEILVFND